MKENTKTPNLLALKDFLREYPELLGERQMRRIIASAATNGAHVWLHKIGRSHFIDVDQFFEWTKSKATRR